MSSAARFGPWAERRLSCPDVRPRARATPTCEGCGQRDREGLREVVAADTTVSDIDGDAGRLWYAGYEIADLAEHATFEGRLPVAQRAAPDAGRAGRAERAPHREPRAEPLPHAADVDAGTAVVTDVDATHLDLGRIGLRPRRLGRVARGPVPQGDAPDREDPGADRLLRAHADSQEIVAPNPSCLMQPTSCTCSRARSPTTTTPTRSTRRSSSTRITR